MFAHTFLTRNLNTNRCSTNRTYSVLHEISVIIILIYANIIGPEFKFKSNKNVVTINPIYFIFVIERILTYKVTDISRQLVII